MFSTGLASSSGVLWRALRNASFAVAAAVGLMAGAAMTTLVEARTPDNPASVVSVALATLPPQAQATYRLILVGGPYPFPKDGIVFGNRERQLPAQARGYYREYTVTTPRASNRGARRIVCGGKPPNPPAACYYTDDHYASFRHIVQ